MANKLVLFTIAFENAEGHPVQFPIKNFFRRLETSYSAMDKAQRLRILLRQIGDESFYLFRSYWNVPSDTRFALPIGKVKTRNLPVVEDPTTFEPKAIQDKLFVISQFVCDFTEKIAAIHLQRESPSAQDIEDYLNTFVPRELGVKLRLRPIIINKGAEQVRNASLVRDISISLDLGQPLNSFYNQQVAENQRTSLPEAIKRLANASKDVNGRTFNIHLGLGQSGSRSDTLDYDSILALIDQLDIDSNLIKEIEVRYRNGEREPIDTAKLKNSSVQVFHWFGRHDSLGAEFLLHNFDEVINDQRRNYRNARDTYFSEEEQWNQDMDLHIVTEFQPEDYYNETEEHAR
ncbi:hypothetical protein LJC04_02175 [Ruminococcaceae bacterium OttesenSCG-928-O06]|nr:hypothetical protein [Ruminococcaceae bacterium OttesenSCG-928-O06]